MRHPSTRNSPLVTGALLFVLGLLLRRWHPDALRLPEPPRRGTRGRGVPRAARQARDGIARVLPTNLTGSIGRTLAIAGAGLVLVRLLDMTVDDDDSLF